MEISNKPIDFHEKDKELTLSLMKEDIKMKKFMFILSVISCAGIVYGTTISFKPNTSLRVEYPRNAYATTSCSCPEVSCPSGPNGREEVCTYGHECEAICHDDDRQAYCNCNAQCLSYSHVCIGTNTCRCDRAYH